MSLVYFTQQMASTSICVITNDRMLFFMYMCPILLIQSVINIISISCLSIVNTGMRLFLQQCSFLSRSYAVSSLGHMAAVSHHWRLLAVFHSAVLLYVPPTVCARSFLCSHQLFYFCNSFDFFYDLYFLLFNYVYVGGVK